MLYKSLQGFATLVAVTRASPLFPIDTVPGKFIVTLQPNSDVDFDLHTRWVSEVHADGLRRRGGDAQGIEKTYTLPGFRAYSGVFDNETLDTLKANASTLRVEPDKVTYLTSAETQENPPWGLAAISNPYPFPAGSPYTYDSTAGEGTFAYVFDSGILLEHVDFEGRAVFGTAPFTGESDKLHGTLVSAIVGGKSYGVAKKTTVIDVQVTGTDSGTLTALLEGAEWTVNDVVSKNRAGKSVINMSLSMGDSPTFNDAVQSLIDAGISVVVAAGNSNSNASDWSPGNQPNTICVGASDKNYKRASFSNWGPAVDIFAPGVDILTAGSSSPTANYTSSGTSEASPHVAGFVSYLLGLEGPRTPAEIKDRVLGLALKDKIEDPKGSSNLFLHQ